jgi:hypothetical protein
MERQDAAGRWRLCQGVVAGWWFSGADVTLIGSVRRTTIRFIGRSGPAGVSGRSSLVFLIFPVMVLLSSTLTLTTPTPESNLSFLCQLPVIHAAI